MAPLTPEQQARERIDQMLVAAGCAVQHKKDLNPSAALGVAERESDTDLEPADYILFADQFQPSLSKPARTKTNAHAEH